MGPLTKSPKSTTPGGNVHHRTTCPTFGRCTRLAQNREDLNQRGYWATAADRRAALRAGNSECMAWQWPRIPALVNCWLVAKEMGEKPPEEEKPAELYPIMGLAQKRTRKDLFEVCFCYTCVYFLGGFGMLSTCNQQLASAYSMIARVTYGASIAIVLPTHINKPEYIFQFPRAWSEHRTSLLSENCPNRSRPRYLCHTKWSVYH